MLIVKKLEFKMNFVHINRDIGCVSLAANEL